MGLWRGAGAGLKEIEVLPSARGPPTVCLHGDAAEVGKRASVAELAVTISHSGAYAMAVATAQ